MAKQRLDKMTAKDVIDKVDTLVARLNNPNDTHYHMATYYQETLDLMYDFIKGLHPSTMMLPRPLKKK